MNISILTVFPNLYQEFLATSLICRAQEQQTLSFDLTSFFSYVQPKERIDAPTFGHGSGLLIKPDVIEKAIQDKERQYGKAFKIFFSPQGKRLTQPLLEHIASKAQETQHVMCVASRYEGIDERVEQEYADLTISLGDYVIMGGDLPAMVLIEGFTRLLPGVVGKKESVEHESFSGPFVDYPEFTEPIEWHGKTVPEVIRSGNHKAIQAWREQQAAQKTVLQHFEWLRSGPMTEQQKKLAVSLIPSHYCVLMHTDILLPAGRVGTTSVTSLDIHDIARSAKTYGLKNYFIVTPLVDQQRIVQQLLSFWQTGVGIEYNKQRHEALDAVRLRSCLDEVINEIEKIEGCKPLVIATSARPETSTQVITYDDQELVWQQKRPVLFLFGTGKGLAPELLKRCDYILMPVVGFSDFNHLSVRSAAAIIFDRWLGISIKPERIGRFN